MLALAVAVLAKPGSPHRFSARELELLAWYQAYDDTYRAMLGASVNVLANSAESGSVCHPADRAALERDLASRGPHENDCAVCTWLTTPAVSTPAIPEATSRALAQSTWLLCGRIAEDAELPAPGGPLLSAVRTSSCARCSPD